MKGFQMPSALVSEYETQGFAFRPSLLSTEEARIVTD